MDEQNTTKQHTAKERYEKLKEKREQYLDRALREFAFMEDNIVDTKDFEWNEEAIKEKYNFFSYGDSMLII